MRGERSWPEPPGRAAPLGPADVRFPQRRTAMSTPRDPEMAKMQISLTEAELLRAISRRTGKAEEELVREALDLLNAQVSSQDRRALLRRAKGIWRDRDDLPTLSELRAEMDR